MDDKFKRRIIAFYFAGFVNLVLGLYVLVQGRALVEPTMWLVLLFFFFGFAAVDFWFARNLKKKWMEAYQEHLAKQQAAPKGREEGGRMTDEGGRA